MSRIWSGSGTLTRREDVVFHLDLDADRARRHRRDIELLLDGPPPSLGPIDTLKLDYRVVVDYFGEVEAKMAAMLRILEDDSVIVDVGIEELQHGMCLVAEVVARMSELKFKIEGRRP